MNTMDGVGAAVAWSGQANTEQRPFHTVQYTVNTRYDAQISREETANYVPNRLADLLVENRLSNVSIVGWTGE